MKVAYLILAHNNPAHLGRLIDGLKSEDASFFVHIDKKSELAKFVHLANNQVVFSEKRVPVFWGTFSQVEATLALIQQALGSSDVVYDYFVLLSGADYPIQSPEYIHAFFEQHRGKQFISTLKMPNIAAGKPLALLEDYNVEGRFKRIKKRVYRLLQTLHMPGLKRNYKAALDGLTPHGGAQWWALTREACLYVNEFVATHPRFLKLYQQVVVPDEMFFQTIVANSPFAAGIARSLTYSDWQAGKSSPENLTTEHVKKLKSQPRYLMSCVNYGEGEILFARKFVGETEPIVALMKKYVYA